MTEAVAQGKTTVRMLPEQAEEKTKNRLVGLLSFILIFSVMNVTMLNVVLPDIASEFGLLPSQVGWLVTAYAMIYALGSLTYGKLADLYPLKRLITIGLCLFALGSLIGFLSAGFEMLLVGRIVQSAGASAIPALALLIPTRYFAPKQRGRVLGIIASTIAFAAGIGPIVGGFVAGVLDWRYLFLLSFGTLLSVPFFRRWLVDENPSTSRFDAVGGLLLGCSVLTLLYGITNLEWWAFMLFVGLLAAFIYWIHWHDEPFVQPNLFHNASYREALISSFLAFGSIFAVMFMTPMMLKQINHLETQFIGLVLFPGAMSAALMGRLGGKLVDQRGSLWVVYVAFMLYMFGMFSLSVLAGYAVWWIALGLILGNIAFSFIQPGMTKIISISLPREQTGVGMGIFSLLNFMAGSISGAIVSKVLDHKEMNFTLNPLLLVPEANLYSNVYFILFLLTLLNGVWFYRVTRR